MKASWPYLLALALLRIEWAALTTWCGPSWCEVESAAVVHFFAIVPAAFFAVGLVSALRQGFNAAVPVLGAVLWLVVGAVWETVWYLGRLETADGPLPVHLSGWLAADALYAGFLVLFLLAGQALGLVCRRVRRTGQLKEK